MDKEKIKSRYRSIMTWEGGQRLFNFAYSIGAAIVILGALFKIIHLPGGNTLLCIGMGTEVLMFIITAFDRPPKDYRWEEVFPELEKGDGEISGSVPRDAGRSYAASVPVKNEDVESVMAQPDVTVVNVAYVEQMTAISEQLARLRGDYAESQFCVGDAAAELSVDSRQHSLRHSRVKGICRTDGRAQPRSQGCEVYV